MAGTDQLTPLGHALAGALGGVVSNALVYPLDTVKTRIQAAQDEESTVDGEKTDGKKPATRKSRQGILQLLLRIWKREGVSGFFKGFTANMINTFSMQFAYFFFHTSLRTFTLKRLSARSQKPITQLSTASELILGALAGAFAQIFTIPVAVIATRQQLHESEDKNARSPSLLETARDIIDESGPTGLWMGLKPGLVLTVNPAITYGVFERVKGILLVAQGLEGGDALRLTAGKSFMLGVLSKTLATVATYPYIYAKVRLQASHGPKKAPLSTLTESTSGTTTSYAEAASTQPEHEHASQFVTSSDIESNTSAAPAKQSVSGMSAIDILKQTYQRKGFAGWYQGMQAQILKAVLSQGILFLLKDQFETYALVIMALARRLIRRSPAL